MQRLAQQRQRGFDTVDHTKKINIDNPLEHKAIEISNIYRLCDPRVKDGNVQTTPIVHDGSCSSDIGFAVGYIQRQYQGGISNLACQVM